MQRFKKPNLKIVVALLLMVLISASVGYVFGNQTATTNYHLDTPFGDADYYIAQYSNSSYYAINASTWQNFLVTTNASYAFSTIIGNLSSGGKIDVGSGLFSITNTITMTDQVWINGAGRGTVLELDANVPMFVSSSGNYMKLSNLVLDANDRSYPLVNFTNSIHGDIEYCTFYDSLVDFVTFSGGSNSYYNTFAHNTITNRNQSSMTANSGCGLRYSQDGYVYDNTIDCQGSGNGLLYTGIVLNGPGTEVYGNHITYQLNYSIEVLASGCSIHDNWFDSPYISGVRVGTLDGLNIADNHFYDCGWNSGTSVDLNGVAKNILLTGNIFTRGSSGLGAGIGIGINTNAAGNNITGIGNLILFPTSNQVSKNGGVTGTLTFINTATQDFTYYKVP